MGRFIGFGLTVIGGIALGATMVSLNAQSKAPSVYAVIDVTEITDPETYKTLFPKAVSTATAFGGRYFARTDNIVAVDGTPPKRLVIIGFDSMDKAQAWEASSDQKEVDTIRLKSSKSRLFFVEGLQQ